jgi:hypothetical protein
MRKILHNPCFRCVIASFLPFVEYLSDLDRLFIPQMTGIRTMLSATQRVCGNKDIIFQKMKQLRDKLVGFVIDGQNKLNLRVQQESSTKQIWLDEEGQYAIQKAACERGKITVASDVKHVIYVQDLLALSKIRLAKVKANNTEELGEIDDEEAIIRELLGYISDLTKSTVDVVCFSSRLFAIIFIFIQQIIAKNAHHLINSTRHTFPDSDS